MHTRISLTYICVSIYLYSNCLPQLNYWQHINPANSESHRNWAIALYHYAVDINIIIFADCPYPRARLSSHYDSDPTFVEL